MQLCKGQFGLSDAITEVPAPGDTATAALSKPTSAGPECFLPDNGAGYRMIPALPKWKERIAEPKFLDGQGPQFIHL